MARSLDERYQLVKCRFCGEMYSPTYKRCPFCNGDGTGRWDDLEKAVQQASESEVMGEYYAWNEDNEMPESPSKGGKRLLNKNTGDEDDAADDTYNYGDGGGGRGPSIGRVLAVLLSLGLIAAAVCIIVSIVKPMLGGGKTPSAASKPPAASASIQPSVSLPSESVNPIESEVPEESGSPEQSDIPDPSTAPAEQTTAPVGSSAPVQSGQLPTSFRLSKEDFSFKNAGESYRVAVTFQPSGTSANVTWKSSNPSVATVSADGRVTAVSKGTVTVTATVAGVGERSCIVRCRLDTAASSGQTGQNNQGGQTTSSNAKLNREDFTLQRKGETFRMKVTGVEGTVTWSTSNANVASISSDGTVTGVGRGTCTVSASVGGQTLTCIVRCSF